MCRAVRTNLPRDRFRHVLGVARTAERLARRYGASASKARAAAMLHDIARMWGPQRLVEFAAAHGLAISENERSAPVLLHARVAALIARDQFGIDDLDVLAAIEHHTVAQPGMSDLEKILYIADSTEPSRAFSGRAALERAAGRSLDEGMLACIESSMDYLKSHGVAAAHSTLALYQQLVEQREAHT
jgi:predicted HD superfamily hydrolase involved in NAD metabolism